MAIAMPVAASDPSPPKVTLVKHALGASGFVGAKAMVFLAPLFVLRTVGVHDYGVLEYALAWGTPLAVLFCLGAGGALPFFLLKRGRSRYIDVFRLYGMAAGLAIIPAAMLLLFHVIAFPVYLAALITIIFVLQTIYASAHRAFGSPAMSSLAESGNYVLILVFVVVAFLARRPVTLPAIAIILTIYAGFLSGHSFAHFNWSVSWRHHWLRTKKVLGFGFPLIATGLLTAVLTSSGRLLAGHFFSMDAVGVYSFFLRISSAVILIHQLMNTLIFPRVYRSDDRALDKYFSSLMGTIFVVSLCEFFLSPLIMGPFLPLLRNVHGENRRIFFVFSFQMIFWAGIAMLEIVINRENTAKHFVGVLFGSACLLVAAISTLHALNMLTLLRLCQLNMSCIFVCFLAQTMLLRRRGVRLFFVPALGLLLYTLYIVFNPYVV